MNQVQTEVDAPPDQVWDVLADGWLYPLWVVGATRMREVDDGWPDPGTRLHHSVGVWPLVIDDTTEVLESVVGRMMRLRAKAWPSGEAEVLLRIEDRGAGSTVTIDEDLVAGPGLLVPRPLRSLALEFRNRESLRRLGWLAERRA
jgi:uncharacterized protein YndB with AHSA1/START domain